MKNDSRHDSPEIRKLQKRISDLERENISLKDKTSAMLNMMEDLEHAKTRIEESEIKFRSLFEKIADGVLVADSKTRRFLFGNPQIHVMLGYEAGETRSLGMEDIHPKDDLPRVLEAFDRLVRGEINMALDIPVLRKNGSVIDADITANAIVLDGRKCMMGIFRDITERKRSEASIRLLAALVDYASDAIIATDPHFNITIWNHAAESIYGWRAEEVLGHSIQKILPAEFIAITEQEVEEQLIQKGFWSGEMIQRHKNGRAINVFASTSQLLNKKGDLQGALTINRDITERKRAEEALRESEETFRLAFDTSPDSMAILRLADEVFVSVNRGFEQLSGYTPKEVLGKPASKIMRWKNIGDREKYIEEFKSRGEVRNFEAPLWTKHGEIHGLMSASLIVLNGVPHVLSITRDITERKQAEEELRKRMDELVSWQNVTLARENRVIELKNEVNILLIKLGKPPRYQNPDA